ncbi:MAG: YwhD family protein [Firmicutes bacterium]|nr:YwhD family protein [Bacillota bacterium]
MERLQLKAVDRHKRPDALANLSAIIIDGDEVYIDNAAIHGKGKFEKGIHFTKAADEVASPRRIALVWATLRRFIAGHGINGLAACVIYIDQESGIGYKNLADQVNKMDGAVKGKIMLEALNDHERTLLGSFLMAQREELWVNATPSVWEQWLTAEEYAPLLDKQKQDEAYRDKLARDAVQNAEDLVD